MALPSPNLGKKLVKGARLRYNAQEWHNNLTLFGTRGYARHRRAEK